MLTPEDIMQLNNFFKLNIKAATVQKINGGDVNETYIVESETKKYIIKKIHDHEYAKDYSVTLKQIISSITFSEHIAQQLLYTAQVSSALFAQQDCVLKSQSGLLIVYPFFSGKIKENNAISLEMIKKIAAFLALIHHKDFYFDHSFAEEKMKIFKKIGQEILDLSLWKKIKSLSHKAYFLPKLNQIAEYLLNNKKTFHEEIEQLVGNAICHNDLKPKNVLWTDEQLFAIVDWETTGLFDLHADYLDTLLAWCTHYNGKKVILNHEKAQAFIASYPIATQKDLKSKLPLVFIKWYFWLAFCIKKMIENPKQWKHYHWHIRYSINFIIFLINNDIFRQLESIDSMKNPHE